MGKSKFILSVMLLLLSAVCFVLTNTMCNIPLSEKTDSADKETEMLRDELLELITPKDAGTPEDWQRVIDAEKEYAQYISENPPDGSEIRSFSGELKAQNQLDFLLNLQQKTDFSPRSVKFGGGRLLYVRNDFTVYEKSLSFDYSVSGYSEFVSLIEAIKTDETYPSSVVDFTFVIAENGGISGNMQTVNYYAPLEKTPYSFDAEHGVEVGGEEVFRRD